MSCRHAIFIWELVWCAAYVLPQHGGRLMVTALGTKPPLLLSDSAAADAFDVRAYMTRMRK